MSCRNNVDHPDHRWQLWNNFTFLPTLTVNPDKNIKAPGHLFDSLPTEGGGYNVFGKGCLLKEMQ